LSAGQLDGLRRDLGLVDAVGIGFGAIVGGGIFVVTGIAAGVAGPAFIAALLIAGAAAAANALSSAQLAAVYPQSGGTYEYGYRVLSPWTGFAAGCAFLISKIAAAGTVAIGLGGYLSAVLPALPPRGVAVGAVLVFTALNYFGVRRSSRANLVIVMFSIGSLLAFCVAVAPAFDSHHLSPFAPAGLAGVMQAAGLLFFAYTGYARIATLGEEVHDPARTIPRAVLITIGGALLLYLAVGLSAAGAVPAAELARTTAPLHAVASAVRGPSAALIVSAGGIAAMLGVILSQVLGLSRMVFAMARRGDLPTWLSTVHPRYRTPHRAVLLVGAVASVVAAAGTLGAAAAAAAFSILVYYGITNLAALRLPAAQRLYPRGVAYFGFVACAVLALSLTRGALALTVALLGTALLVRAAVRRPR
jgi:basic amino acid/polyamine antiporter, APA family